MFKKNRSPHLVTIIAAVLLSSCVEATLPRFDGGVLNPEIRFLRAGEIMDGVKCAMVAFMHEREQELLKSRKDDKRLLDEKYPDKKCPLKQGEGPKHCQIEGQYFGPFHTNADISVVVGGDPSVEVGVSGELESNRTCGIHKHWQWEYGNSAADPRKQWRLKCVENECDESLVRRDREGKIIAKDDHRMGISVWDYTVIRTEKGYTEKGCVSVPDYSRLALDLNQSVTIQLTLQG